jgi:hypothetical protein
MQDFATIHTNECTQVATAKDATELERIAIEEETLNIKKNIAINTGEMKLMNEIVLRKKLDEIRVIKGTGTSLISIYIPNDRPISDVRA